MLVAQFLRMGLHHTAIFTGSYPGKLMIHRAGEQSTNEILIAITISASKLMI
jgi:hypothetical protein